MAKAKMTRDIAFAAATDAGNRHMRRYGRTVWDETDYDEAARTYETLWPASKDEEDSAEHDAMCIRTPEEQTCPCGYLSLDLWTFIAQAAATAQHYGFTTIEVVNQGAHFAVLDKSKEDRIRK